MINNKMKSLIINHTNYDQSSFLLGYSQQQYKNPSNHHHHFFLKTDTQIRKTNINSLSHQHSLSHKSMQLKRQKSKSKKKYINVISNPSYQKQLEIKKQNIAIPHKTFKQQRLVGYTITEQNDDIIPVLCRAKKDINSTLHKDSQHIYSQRNNNTTYNKNNQECESDTIISNIRSIIDGELGLQTSNIYTEHLKNHRQADIHIYHQNTQKQLQKNCRNYDQIHTPLKKFTEPSFRDKDYQGQYQQFSQTIKPQTKKFIQLRSKRHSLNKNPFKTAEKDDKTILLPLHHDTINLKLINKHSLNLSPSPYKKGMVTDKINKECSYQQKLVKNNRNSIMDKRKLQIKSQRDKKTMILSDQQSKEMQNNISKKLDQIYKRTNFITQLYLKETGCCDKVLNSIHNKNQHDINPMHLQFDIQKNSKKSTQINLECNLGLAKEKIKINQISNKQNAIKLAPSSNLRHQILSKIYL